jgi:hypothetical protein
VVSAQDPGLAVLELDALVFTAWQTDRSEGLDAIMRAPTRELVSQLSQRTRSHRLDTEPNHRTAALPVVMLADGNPASVGDQVISRANNRALRITAGPQVIKVQAPQLASVDPRHQVAVTSQVRGVMRIDGFERGSRCSLR